MKIFETKAALVAATLTAGQLVQIKGETTAGLKAGTYLVRTAAEIPSPNGTTQFAIANGNVVELVDITARVTTSTGTQTLADALDQRGPVFATVAAMKTLSPDAGITIETGGYYDGWAAFLEPQGAGRYNTATLADVRATKGNPTWVPDELIDHTCANGVVAMLSAESGRVDFKQAGAKNSSSFDSTANIQAAINTRSCYASYGTYKVTATLLIDTNNTSIEGDSGRTATLLRSGDYGDTILFQRTDPLTQRIGFCSIKNLRFFTDSTATLPTHGAHLHFNRPQAVELSNLDVSEHFGGIHFEGGAGVFLDNIKVNSGQFYSSLQVGSYFVKWSPASTSGSNEFPSEYYATNLNNRTAGAALIENGIVIEASDGINITTGHIGFTSLSALLVQPVNASDSLNGINFCNVHFDGNFNTTNGVLYNEPSAGFHTGAAFGHTYTGCQFSICSANGMRFNLESLTGLEVTGGRVSSNAAWGAKIEKGSGFVFSGVRWQTNGNNAAGSGHVLLSNDVTDVDISGVFGGTYYRGVQMNDTVDRVSVRGSFSGATAEDVFMNSSNTNHQFKFISDKAKVLASAGSLVIPHGVDVYEISGTTNITNISGFGRAEGREVTLKFQDILTVVDGGNLLLSGNFVTSASDTLTLVNTGSTWVEKSRSVN